MEYKIFKTIGSILKKEILLNVSNDFSKKYFVLKNVNPFPGYYEQIIPDKKNLEHDSLFLITKEDYSNEKIFRTAKFIKNCCGLALNLAPGTIEVFNMKKSCIRVKGLADLNILISLIEEFNKYGIKIDKQNQVQQYSGLIKIFKFFELRELDKEEWKDLNNKKLSYFKLNKYISWEEFENVTLKIKNNIDNNLFDAAQGVFYIDNSITDIVRIYSANVDKNRLNKIKELYFQYVK